jgi:hypothetical protein
MTSIQYTEWWWSGALWYVMANGHSGCGGTKEQAMADAREEMDKFWRRAKAKRVTAANLRLMEAVLLYDALPTGPSDAGVKDV